MSKENWRWKAQAVATILDYCRTISIYAILQSIQCGEARKDNNEAGLPVVMCHVKLETHHRPPKDCSMARRAISELGQLQPFVFWRRADMTRWGVCLEQQHCRASMRSQPLCLNDYLPRQPPHTLFPTGSHFCCLKVQFTEYIYGSQNSSGGRFSSTIRPFGVFLIAKWPPWISSNRPAMQLEKLDILITKLIDK